MAKENTELMKKIIDDINKYIGNDKDYNGNIEVRDHENIPIRIINKGEEISRGKNAFQTDIALISSIQENKEEENFLPLVIIEVKGSESITTHDILNYSFKARRHKNIYPWLRYGMVWSSLEKKCAPKKLYMNNESLDFAFNFNGDVDNNFQNFYENILRKQIIISSKLHEILNGETGTPYFSSNVDFGYKGKEDCKEIEGD